MDQENRAPCLVRAEQGRILFEGGLTSLALPELMNAYRDAGQGGTIRLDFSRLESIDISGVNTLIKLFLRARAQGTVLEATGLSPSLREVFSSTRIDEAISCEARAGNVPMPPGWAANVSKLEVDFQPAGALNLNIDGRRPQGPIQGFGHLWQKTYLIELPGVGKSPAEVMRVCKENFPALQPPQNRFYPSPRGIAPGEIVLINASTPAGLIATGVWVVHADDESFTLMAPEGHPEAGWVSFKAFEERGMVSFRIQGFARAGDPVYEAGFVLMGSKEQEKIWRHVLSSLAGLLGVQTAVAMDKVCVASDYQWGRVGNVFSNAQALTMLHTIRKMTGL